MYHSSSSVSWTTTHLVAQKSIMKIPNQKSPNSQNVFLSFFFLSSSSSVRLVKIVWLFYEGFCSKQQYFTLTVHQLIAFWQLWRLMIRFKLDTEEPWLHLQCHFLHLCTKHLAYLGCINQLCCRLLQRNVIITQDHWIRNMESVHGALETGSTSIIHCWLDVWTDAWSVVFQPILHTSTEEACEDRLAALW